MQNKRRDPKWWLIVALINILAMEYPAAQYLQAGEDSSRMTAAMILAGVGVVLAIADFFAIVLAVA